MPEDDRRLVGAVGATALECLGNLCVFLLIKRLTPDQATFRHVVLHQGTIRSSEGEVLCIFPTEPRTAHRMEVRVAW